MCISIDTHYLHTDSDYDFEAEYEQALDAVENAETCDNDDNSNSDVDQQVSKVTKYNVITVNPVDVVGDGETCENDDVDLPESHVCIFQYVYFMNVC